MTWRAVCGESRTHGSEGADDLRGLSATLLTIVSAVRVRLGEFQVVLMDFKVKFIITCTLRGYRAG